MVERLVLAVLATVAHERLQVRVAHDVVLRYPRGRVDLVGVGRGQVGPEEDGYSFSFNVLIVFR